MNKSFTTIFTVLWLTIISAGLVHLYIRSYDETQKNIETTKETGKSIQTLQSQLSDVGDTVNSTLQGLALTYGNETDMVAFLDMRGSITLNGFIFAGDLPNTNITTVFTEEQRQGCENCTEKNFYSFTIDYGYCCTTVGIYISADFAHMCLAHYSSTTSTECMKISPCKYITVAAFTVGSTRNLFSLYTNFVSNCG